jgi:hypothetical protein
MSNQYKALTGTDVTVAMMTSGGLAPCLSASIAQLVKSWVAAKNAGQITGLTFRMYKSGYKGMLTGDSFILPESDWDKCESLLYLGGSPIGNSRVKVRDTFRRTRNDSVGYPLAPSRRPTSCSPTKILSQLFPYLTYFLPMDYSPLD